MPTCFVMQPFDRGVFDKRYREVFEPAIKAAGLEAYRVDQDPKVSVPIDDIESGIRSAHICLADISKDNPNVWFELGYAIACHKEVVLVCSNERNTAFPFDVQHRTIISYETGSPSDFIALKERITEKIAACITKLSTLPDISKIARVEGLEQHEVFLMATLVANLDHPEDHCSIYVLKRDMESSGFTKLAATLAITSLLQKGMIDRLNCFDRDAEETYAGYSPTSSGWAWVLSNKNQFNLRKLPEDDLLFDQTRTM